MKKKFAIFILESKDVHVPSTDYYARNNEAQTETVPVMSQVGDTFDTFEEAERDILDGDYSNYKKGYTLTIMPLYVNG